VTNTPAYYDMKLQTLDQD